MPMRGKEKDEAMINRVSIFQSWHNQVFGQSLVKRIWVHQAEFFGIGYDD